MSLEHEVTALRQAAGLSRATHVALVRVEGPGGFDLLQHACTQAPHLREGLSRHTLLLGDDGAIFADAYVAAVDDGFWLLAEGPSERALVDWLCAVHGRRAAAGAEAAVRAMSPEWGVLAVDGPYAWQVVAELLGASVLGMPYLSMLRHQEWLCLRAGTTGEYGYWLLLPRSEVDAVERKLFALGESIAMTSVGLEALDVCALENWHFCVRALPSAPILSPVAPLTPFELQLQWRVANAKEFVGAAALRARREAGIKARATCFIAEGPVAAGQRVGVVGAHGDAVAGAVLSCCHSPTLERWVGSVLLAAPLAHPHVPLRTVGDDAPVSLRTQTTPLVDNKSLHIKPQEAWRLAHALPRPVERGA
jgi:aminomethyltransferase